ncbi:MAG: adenylate/guanylate cyclase domain-containing protein [Isosphaeraceae bacterium]|nr:adenylate/guanylate cyclase domain-containing protein [Isosphaeraceae bacterium]
MARVLVVEDSPTQAQQMAFIFEDAGFEVATAPDAETGFTLLQKGPFDVVLTDLHLPGDSGFELCRRLKEDPRLCTLPVVVCTSEAEPTNVLRGLQAGADGFITKQRDPEEIVRAVQRVLARPPETDHPARSHVAFLGQEFELEAGRAQLADILVSAFEDVVHLNAQLAREKARADELLHVILPDRIVVELKATNAVRPRRHEDVAVMFADIVGFTQYCEQHRPEEVVAGLQRLIERWEEIAARFGVQKIKTIGDAFMAASGLLTKEENAVLNCVRAGREMIAASRELPTGWSVRVGIHVGQVVAGVLGHRQYQYDLWGDTVNEAARIESHGVPDAITLSVEAWQRIAGTSRGESLGAVPVKGKGMLEIIRFLGFLNE